MPLVLLLLLVVSVGAVAAEDEVEVECAMRLLPPDLGGVGDVSAGIVGVGVVGRLFDQRKQKT
ncbi:MAG: hypothetical protein V3R25_06895 [Nitrosomonadaceae bacterium]